MTLAPVLSLRRALRRLAERLGPAGVVGAALLAGCAGFYVLTVRPLALELAALEDASVSGTGPRQRVDPDDSSGSLRRFTASFPEESELAGLLAKLYAIGERSGVRLAQGEYRFIGRDALGMVQYKITLPVIGRYPQIRRFVGTALSEIAWVAVNQVNLQRERVGQSRIDARLELTMHLRAGGAAVVRDSTVTEPYSVAKGEAK